MAASLELAENIAAMSPVAIQGTKVNLNYARDHSVQEGLDFVVSLYSAYHVTIAKNDTHTLCKTRILLTYSFMNVANFVTILFWSNYMN